MVPQQAVQAQIAILVHMPNAKAVDPVEAPEEGRDAYVARNTSKVVGINPIG